MLGADEVKSIVVANRAAEDSYAVQVNVGAVTNSNRVISAVKKVHVADHNVRAFIKQCDVGTTLATHASGPDLRTLPINRAHAFDGHVLGIGRVHQTDIAIAHRM